MGDVSPVTICWENYLQYLSGSIWSFFNENELADVTLTCHGQSMKVHGFMLSLFSPVLKDSLASIGDDISQPASRQPLKAVNLDFVTDQGTDLRYLLEFLYRGQVSLPKTRVKPLLNTAGLLGVRGLVDAIHSLGSEDMDTHQGSDELKEKRDFGMVAVSSDERVALAADSGNEGSADKGMLVDSPKDDVEKRFQNEHLHHSENNSMEGKVYIEANSDSKDDATNVIVESESGFDQKVECGSSVSDDKNDESEDVDSQDDKDSEGKKHKKVRRKAYQHNWRKSRPFLACPNCDYKSRDSSNFKKHMEHHSLTNGSHKYVCEICSKTFRSRRGFKCHQLGHADPERQHKCLVCDFCTPQRWSLIKHLAVMHKVDEKGIAIAESIKCTLCNYCCIADHQLKAHMLRKHTDPLNKPFKCEQCSYSTVIKYELEKHVGIRHRNERRYMCEYCSFRSQTHSGLVRHQRSHSGIKPYKCQDCGMEYADGGKFKAHILRHSKDEKGFICHICAHACRRKDNLRMHLRRIHGTDLDETGDAVFPKMGASK